MTTRTFTVMIGYKVPLSKITVRRSVCTHSCEHMAESQSVRALPFCPQCGRKNQMINTVSIEIKPQFKELFDESGLHDHGRIWSGNFQCAQGRAMVSVDALEYDKNPGFGKYDPSFHLVAGVAIACEDFSGAWCSKTKLVPIPTKDELADFLTESGIPFTRRSWGLFSLMELS